ncbi:MAG TPA: penicillin-binding protein 2 [Anaerolineae bacterium]|nr:penicillin-binding protein 2 [Anaerolineae bacterium]
MSNINSYTRNTISKWRLISFIIVVSLVFTGYIGELIRIQIFDRDTWVAFAEDNRINEISIPALRGVIYDRNGYVLARNIASYNVVIIPANLPDEEGAIQDIFRQLSKLINVPINLNEVTSDNPYVPCVSDHGIAQIVNYGETSAPFEPVKIKCDIDREIAMKILEKSTDWLGVSIEVEPIRDYPTGSITAPLIGFLGPISSVNEEYYRERGFVPNRDKIGYAGVERSFNSLLAGKPGKRVVEVDVAGKIIRDVKPTIPSFPGQNIYLTIDTRLQQAVEAILKSEIDQWNNYFNEIRITSGVVIAMNPQTGEILAMVNFPSYENNRFARYIPSYYYEQLIRDARDPLLNHAVGAELPAGSVFKITTAVGALNEGVVTPDQIISTPGEIYITEKYTPNDPGHARKFVDWNRAGFGQLDFLGGIANSSNVYFYKLGGGYKDEVPEGLGICRLGTYARALGYGDYPGIELPDQADGLVPDPHWKRITQGENWSIGDTYIASVGQGFVIATPLQVLMSASVIAADGKLMRPTIIHDIVDSQGNVIQPFQPDLKWDITQDPVIDVYSDPTSAGGCEAKLTGDKITVEPWVIQKVQEGMRKAVTSGTLIKAFKNFTVASAGKTGTAEYCDEFANAKNLCKPGDWPSHAWTVAYAPYDNPEIAVVAFVYNGLEGSSVAAPIVRKVLEAYFELKVIDSTSTNP